MENQVIQFTPAILSSYLFQIVVAICVARLWWVVIDRLFKK